MRTLKTLTAVALVAMTIYNPMLAGIYFGILLVAWIAFRLFSSDGESATSANG